MKSYLWLFVFVSAVSADLVRFHDGKELEGEIVAETATNLTLEVSLAHGTIFQTQIIPKSNIASFARWTPAEKRAATMKRESLALSRQVLHPDNSQPLRVYDETIAALEKFLTAYPDAPTAPELTRQLVDWQAERQKVRAGMVKSEGTWIAKEEHDRRQARAKAQIFLKQGNDASAAKQWAHAVRNYDAALALHPGGVTESLAQRQATEALTAWRAEVEPQLKNLEADLAAAQSRFDQAQQAKNSARPSSTGFNQTSSDGKLGGAGGSELLRAHTEFTAAEARLKSLRPQVEKLRSWLTEIDRRLGTPEPTAVATAPAAPAPSGDVLEETAAWWQEYWMMLVGIALVALWLLSRMMAR